jgi:hypothetical protein
MADKIFALLVGAHPCFRGLGCINRGAPDIRSSIGVVLDPGFADALIFSCKFDGFAVAVLVDELVENSGLALVKRMEIWISACQ